MDPEISELYQKLPLRIRDIKSYPVRRDLLKMYQTCEKIRREISQEQVNSRHNLQNHRLLDLYNKFSESVTSLDQYVTLAFLTL